MRISLAADPIIGGSGLAYRSIGAILRGVYEPDHPSEVVACVQE